MQIGSVGIQPYIYNANYVNRNSMNKISAISDDLVSSKTDFSNLADNDLNENPLRRGETSNFVDVLQMQFQIGQQNRVRLIQPVEAENKEESVQNNFPRNVVTPREPVIQAQNPAAEAATPVVSAATTQEASANTQNQGADIMMQRAIEAYQMNMTA